MFNAVRFEEEHRFEGHTSSVMSLSWARNGKRVVSGSQDNTVRLWDVETKRQIGETLNGHSDAITSVAISGDGKIVISASLDHTVRLWLINGDRLIQTYSRKCRMGVRSVSISENGRHAVSSRGTVWDTRRMKRIGKLRVPSSGIGKAIFSQVGEKLVSGSPDGTVKMWNLDEMKQIRGKYF